MARFDFTACLLSFPKYELVQRKDLPRLMQAFDASGTPFVVDLDRESVA